MTKPHITIFVHPEFGELATVVMDKDEFYALCDELKNIVVMNSPSENKRATAAQIESLKAAATIPMISRGKSTESIFNRYEIEQDKMSVIIRGTGRQVLETLLDIEEDNRRRDTEKN